MSHRLKEEFYCAECNSYFDTYLRTNMTGNYTIECANPECKHHHYRFVSKGLITGERRNNFPNLDIIKCLASELRKSPRMHETLSRC